MDSQTGCVSAAPVVNGQKYEATTSKEKLGPRKVLVFGGSGRLGLIIINDLLGFGKDVFSIRVATRYIDKTREKLKLQAARTGRSSDSVEIVKCDVEKPKEVQHAVQDCNVIIYAATSDNIGGNTAFKIDFMGFKNVLECLHIKSKVGERFKMSYEERQEKKRQIAAEKDRISWIKMNAFASSGFSTTGARKAAKEGNAEEVSAQLQQETGPAYEAARQRKMRDIKIVYISVAGCTWLDLYTKPMIHQSNFAKWNFTAEQELRKHDFSYTIIRPVSMNEDPGLEKALSIEQGDDCDWHFASVPREDISTLIIASILSEDSNRKTFEVVTDNAYEVLSSKQEMFYHNWFSGLDADEEGCEYIYPSTK